MPEHHSDNRIRLDAEGAGTNAIDDTAQPLTPALSPSEGEREKTAGQMIRVSIRIASPCRGPALGQRRGKPCPRRAPEPSRRPTASTQVRTDIFANAGLDLDVEAGLGGHIKCLAGTVSRRGAGAI